MVSAEDSQAGRSEEMEQCVGDIPNSENDMSEHKQNMGESSDREAPSESDSGKGIRSRETLDTRTYDFNSDTTIPSDTYIPSWFLDNCVMTAEELAVHDCQLKICETELFEEIEDIETEETRTETYEIDSTVYQPLVDLISQNPSHPQSETGEELVNKSLFSHDAVIVRMPTSRSPTRPRANRRFFQCLIERFAQDACSDLITMDIETMENLAEHFSRMEGDMSEDVPSLSYHLQRCFGKGGDFHDFINSDAAIAGAPFIPDSSEIAEASGEQEHYEDAKSTQDSTEEDIDEYASGISDTDGVLVFEDAMEEVTPNQNNAFDTLQDKCINPIKEIDVRSENTPSTNEIGMQHSPQKKDRAQPTEITINQGQEEEERMESENMMLNRRFSIPVITDSPLGSICSRSKVEDQAIKTQEQEKFGSFRFSSILGSPEIKRRTRDPASTEPARTSMVVHIPEVNKLPQLYSWKLFHALRQEIALIDRPVLVVCSAWGTICCVRCDHRLLDLVGRRPKTQHVHVAPKSTEAQQELFERDCKSEEGFKRENMWWIKRHLRARFASCANLPILQPFAKWDFLVGTRLEVIYNDRNIYSDAILESIADLRNTPTEDQLRGIIRGIGLRYQAILNWKIASTMDQEKKWLAFPIRTRKIIEEIESGDESLEWERDFLSLLVPPSLVNESWSDIELDPIIKKEVEKIISKVFSKSKNSQGILARGAIGGALLYGPPGCGKTHLARILAREAKVPMISVTAAELENEFVGQTEKAVRGLFNLARLLAPSIIFVDEADGLLRKRGGLDHGWERSRKNQFLLEMDGLKRSKPRPFVLLSSNFPSELDHAVLRRVPYRFHIGLPSLEGRIRLMQLYLKEDVIDENVDFRKFARKLQGYSGSDIQTLCFQAAINGNTDELDPPVKALTNANFETALKSIQPTVSQEALTMIRDFAAVFDPAGVALMDTRGLSLRKSVTQLEHSASDSNQGVTPSSHSKTTWGGENEHTCIVNDRDHIPNLEPLKTYLTRHSVDVKATNAVDDHSSDFPSAIMESPFQYHPLEESGEHIRVLKIHPGRIHSDSEDPLRCTLKMVDLNDKTAFYQAISWSHPSARYRLAQWHLASTCIQRLVASPDSTPEEVVDEIQPDTHMVLDRPFDDSHILEPRFNWGDYVALSYVWGDQTDTRVINLNGHRFKVGANLYSALINLRDSFEVQKMGLYLWIDAICIDQENLEERASQVKIMSTIFSEAVSVISWIGNPSNNVAQELPLAREFLDQNEKAGFHEIHASSIQDQVIAISIWTAMSAILSEGYWKRLWIMQEVAIPASLLFKYGDHYFTIDEFRKLQHLFTGGGLGSKILSRLPIQEARNLSKINDAYSRLAYLRPIHDTDSLKSLDTMQLINLAKESKATDPRDKVYGLISLLPYDISNRLQPNYDPANSVDEVFIEFSQICYEEIGFNTLSQFETPPCKRPEFPSWAFDLNSSSQWSLTSISKNRYGASTGMPSSYMKFSNDSRRMFCEGVIVDKVRSLGAYQICASTSIVMGEQGCIASQQPLNRSWKRSFARVLLGDSKFEFSDSHPSVFDSPWLAAKSHAVTLCSKDERLYDGIENQDFYTKIKRWTNFYSKTPLQNLFAETLRPNADFEIGGKPLKSYFSSTDSVCKDPERVLDDVTIICNHMHDRRLIMTEDNLLGAAPHHTKVGDKIAVICGCDMPIILRPVEDQYEVIGNCFIEGLMQGETARDIERGRLKLETIELC